MTLTRDDVALEAYPFEAELAESIILDWFAYLIARTPAKRPFDPESFQSTILHGVHPIIRS